MPTTPRTPASPLTIRSVFPTKRAAHEWLLPHIHEGDNEWSIVVRNPNGPGFIIQSRRDLQLLTHRRTRTLVSTHTIDTATIFDAMVQGFDGWRPREFGRRLTSEEAIAIDLDVGRRGEVFWKMPAASAYTQAFAHWWTALHGGELPPIVEIRYYRGGGVPHYTAEFTVAGASFAYDDDVGTFKPIAP